jgi:uncharacterized protein HemX
VTVEIALLISALSVGFAVYSGIQNLKRNKATDDKKEATEMTTVIVKLENISKDTGEIKNDMKDVKQDVKKNTEQIIRLDESLKSAWKRIALLEEKRGQDPDE